MYNICSKCKDVNCKYRKLAVKDYSIYTTEHCCKNNVESTKKIINTNEFKDFEELLMKYTGSESLELFKKQMMHFKAIAQNELITK